MQKNEKFTVIVPAIQFLFDNMELSSYSKKQDFNYVKFTSGRCKYGVQKYQCKVNSWTTIMSKNYEIKSVVERYVLVIDRPEKDWWLMSPETLSWVQGFTW